MNDANRLCACQRFLIPAGSSGVQEVPLFQIADVALTNHEDGECRSRNGRGEVVATSGRAQTSSDDSRAESVESTHRGRQGRIWAHIPRVWRKSRKRWGDA